GQPGVGGSGPADGGPSRPNDSRRGGLLVPSVGHGGGPDRIGGGGIPHPRASSVMAHRPSPNTTRSSRGGSVASSIARRLAPMERRSTVGLLLAEGAAVLAVAYMLGASSLLVGIAVAGVAVM